MGKEEIQKFRVTITLLDGKEEIIENVVQINPITGSNLLAIILLTGEVIVYVLNENVRKYKFGVV